MNECIESFSAFRNTCDESSLASDFPSHLTFVRTCQTTPNTDLRSNFNCLFSTDHLTNDQSLDSRMQSHRRWWDGVSVTSYDRDSAQTIHTILQTKVQWKRIKLRIQFVSMQLRWRWRWQQMDNTSSLPLKQFQSQWTMGSGYLMPLCHFFDDIFLWFEANEPCAVCINKSHKFHRWTNKWASEQALTLDRDEENNLQHNTRTS